MENIASLNVQIRGGAVERANPGWSGQVLASAPFATLLLIRNDLSVWWGKSEVAASGATISLLLHRNADGTAVQFLYTLNYGGVYEASGTVTDKTFQPLSPNRLQFNAGELQDFCTVMTEPSAHCQLFFLPHTNVYAGRTGVWRPHKRLRNSFPDHLETALFGPRRGMRSQFGDA